MLHLIFHWSAKSPLMERIEQKDALLFLGDAVFGLLKSGQYSTVLHALIKNHPVYVLLSELEIRGIGTAQLVSGIKVIDYAVFVELTTEYTSVCSWN